MTPGSDRAETHTAGGEVTGSGGSRDRGTGEDTQGGAGTAQALAAEAGTAKGAVEAELDGPDAAETARVLSTVLLPTLARGVLVRRPLMEGLVSALEADRGIVSTLRGLRERHGDGPLPLRLAGRDAALVLAADDVRTLLEGTPDPFSSGGREKRGALSHFEPHAVLVSEPEERPHRRTSNEQALATGRVLHPDGDVIAAQADEEARALLAALGDGGVLDWNRFSASFDALARRVVFGASAAGDVRTTELLRRLRARGNWSYAAPVHRKVRAEFLDRVGRAVDRAEPGSLAAGLSREAGSHPEDQAAHWLFAFDAAAIAAFRSLALLTSYSPGAHAAREEIQETGGLDLPLLRATVLESVRLWPTTLAVLRESNRETVWRDRVFPAGTAFVVMSAYFHRDSSRLPYADEFAPEVWIDGRAEEDPGILPFSYGPAGCAGREVVPLTLSLFLRSLVRDRDLTRVDARGPLPASGLPASLNHFALRFTLPGRGA
ncbi:cytochrome P450 [Nocardiopsis tropica]